MEENEYQCAMCGNIFEKGRPDKKAWQKHEDNFPGESYKTAGIVCDDCYQQLFSLP